MNKEKAFDCVKFKYELQENTLKNSGAKNLREYVDYVNKVAQNSLLHREKNEDTVNRASVQSLGKKIAY